MNTQAQVFNLLMAGLPRPELVRDLSMDREGEVDFTLQDHRFRVECETLAVHTVEGHLVSSGFECSLLSQLLKKQNQLSNAQK